MPEKDEDTHFPYFVMLFIFLLLLLLSSYIITIINCAVFFRNECKYKFRNSNFDIILVILKTPTLPNNI